MNHAEDGNIVTIGLKPSYPETGFGYIQIASEQKPGIHAVSRFVEKPDQKTAEGYLKDGNYLWNSGMFFFKAAILLEEIKKHLPELSEALAQFEKAAANGEEKAKVSALYPSVPSISIDNGVMEKTKNIACIPASFAWSDVGSWRSAWELGAKDAHENVVHSGTVLHDSKGCYIKGLDDKIIAVVGLEDLVIVDTKDALLVMPKHRAQDVREIVKQLIEAKKEKVL
ncbi:MAG: mannose-1-phosphate guanylyltransferase [Myxococcales bacterium]|nr:MAG: mannose-1-phosphate guanylyltransferase [Myxococcales bacterium]